jgi:hypothetical protein
MFKDSVAVLKNKVTFQHTISSITNNFFKVFSHKIHDSVRVIYDGICDKNVLVLLIIFIFCILYVCIIFKFKNKTVLQFEINEYFTFYFSKFRNIIIHIFFFM